MTTPARHLHRIDPPWQATDPVLTALAAARARQEQAEAEIRILLAYARELATPRPYRLTDLAAATGKSVSGVRIAYTPGDVDQAHHLLHTLTGAHSPAHHPKDGPHDLPHPDH